MEEERTLAFLESVFEAWKHRTWRCEACPLSLVEDMPGFAYGTAETPVMVVGLSPGGPSSETDTRPSRVLQKVFAEEYLSNAWDSNEYPYAKTLRRMTEGTPFADYKTRIYYTNAVKCFEPQEFWFRSPGNYRDALLHCQEYLCGEIGAVNPRLIVAFGRRTVDAVLDCVGIPRSDLVTPFHLRRLVSPNGDKVVLALHHWASRRGDWEDYYSGINRAFKREVPEFRS